MSSDCIPIFAPQGTPLDWTTFKKVEVKIREAPKGLICVFEMANQFVP